MLTQLGIRNFKCFSELSLRLKPLTLMTGFNAAGKSSALQSLLLLSQCLRSGTHNPELALNGSLVRLGTPGEVLNQGSGDLIFSIEDDRSRVSWTLQAKERALGTSMKIREINISTNSGTRRYAGFERLENLLPLKPSKNLERLINHLREIVFLSAVRLGTSDVFPSPDESNPAHADVGTQGEFAPWWFNKFIDETIDLKRLSKSDEAPTLRRQFNAWASELFHGAQANTLPIEKTNLLRLELRTGETSDWRRPANIGYGLTYAFPVFVTGLLAKVDQTLIIDSPEAHLHPCGQSRMGHFLAQIAQSGVQVLIETHSDHIVNGVRLAVKDGIISPENVAVHFFNLSDSKTNVSSQVLSPLIDLYGNLSEWPDGFFDQSEKDLARLSGWI